MAASFKEEAMPTPEPPEHFMCPISLQIMRDPVLASDEQTYERASLLEWLWHNNTSPVTREPLNGDYRKNHVLRHIIEDWLKEHQQTDMGPETGPKSDPFVGSLSDQPVATGVVQSLTPTNAPMAVSEAQQEDRNLAATQPEDVGTLRTDAGVLRLIQHLANMPKSHSLPYLARTLSCLASTPGFHPATTEAALQALAEVLQKAAVHSRVSAILAKAAAPALSSVMQSRGCPASGLLGAFAAFQLRKVPEIQAAMVEAALPALVALLQDAARPGCQSLAAMFLTAASETAYARGRIAQAAMPHLAAMLLAGGTVLHVLPAFMMQVREAALSVLSSLTLNADAHRGTAALAALPGLVSIIQQGQVPGLQCRQYATWVLQHLAASGNFSVQQRVADDALPGLVRLMRSSSDPREQLAAVEAVSALATARDAKLRRQVHAAAHAQMVLLARQSTDIELRSAAKKALDRLQALPSCVVM